MKANVRLALRPQAIITIQHFLLKLNCKNNFSISKIRTKSLLLIKGPFLIIWDGEDFLGLGKGFRLFVDTFGIHPLNMTEKS